MSYQEYSQLGKGRNKDSKTWRGSTNAGSEFGPPIRERSQTVDSDERPYLGSHISFSAPRRLTQMPAGAGTVAAAAATTRLAPPSDAAASSPTSSTSSASLSPSNSASQKGFHHAKAKAAASSAFSGLSLAQLKEQLELGEGGRGRVGATEKKQPELLADPHLPWRPFYLQRRILASFGVVFVLLIVTLEAVLDLSNRRSSPARGGGGGGGGLGPADRRSLRFAWQLGPTAGLALAAGCWHRVEFQAKSSAAWVRMSRGPADAERTLLLDYVSMLQPVALIRSVRNRDWIVASAVLVSILLRVAVVLSTALVTPALMTVVDSDASLVLRTRFVDDSRALADAAPLSLLHVAALQQRGVGDGGNLSYPDGIAPGFAYQRLEPAAEDNLPAGAQLSATVDGFFPTLACEVAQLSVRGAQVSRSAQQFDTTFTSPTCSVTAPLNGTALARNGSEVVYFLHFGRGGCAGSRAAEDQRIFVVAGISTIEVNATTALGNALVPVNGTISRPVSLLCKPDHSIMRVDIVKLWSAFSSSPSPSLVRAQLASPLPQPSTLSNVSGWDVAAAVFDSYRDSAVADTDPTDAAFPTFLTGQQQQQERVVVDAMGRFALGHKLKDGGVLPSPASVLNTSTLLSLATEYFQHHASLLAHTAAMSQGSLSPMPVVGTTVIRGDRLVVRAVTAHLAVGVLAPCTVLTVVLLFLVPRGGILPRAPDTLMDLAALLGHSKPLLLALRGTGGADSATLWDRLGMAYFYTGVEAYGQEFTGGKEGYFKVFGGPLSFPPGATAPKYIPPPSENWSHPLGLQPGARVLLFVVAAGLIGALEATLRVSDANGGLANVEDRGVLPHFLWTVLPAFIITLVVLYLGLVDFAVRALAPFADLTRPGSFRSMATNFLDKATPFAAYESVTTRNWAVLASTASIFLGSLLIVFVAPLLVADSTPAPVAIQIQTQDFFEAGSSAAASMDSTVRGSGASRASDDGNVVASLILNGNISYPPFTYQDLAFPRVAVAATVTAPGKDRIPSDAVVSATLPAVRASLACRLFGRPEVRVNLTTGDVRIGDDDDVVNPLLRIDLPGVTSRGPGESTFVVGPSPRQQNARQFAVDRNAYFGAARFLTSPAGGVGGVERGGGGVWVYTWGQLENAGTGEVSVRSVSALSCNETMQRVGVAATFRGPALTIDPSRPPVPLESTARESNVFVVPPSDGGDPYAGLLGGLSKTPHLLDGFFASLLSSRFAIPVSALGGGAGDSAEAVVAAITLQHGIVRVQTINAWSRRPINPLVSATNATSTSAAAAVAIIEAGSAVVGGPGAITFPATLQMMPSSTFLSNTSSNPPPPQQRRLRQDVVATRILQAFLAGILGLSAVTWVSMPRTNLLPRLGGLAPTQFSIASLAALLVDGAGGSVFAMLGRNSEWKSLGKIQELFRDGLHVTMRFRLGWDEVRSRDWRRDRDRDRRRDGWGTKGGEDGREGNPGEVFGISAVRTGGWGGGERDGLGLQARIGLSQRRFVRDWGWKV